MPEFERHFASVPRKPQKFPRAPARELADIGAGLEAQAMAQFGRSLTDVAGVVSKWYEREGNRQFDRDVGQAESKMGEFERTIFANADEHDAAFKKLMEKTIPDLAGKNKSGASKFKAYITGKQKAAWEKRADEKKIRMIAGNNLTGYLNDMRNVARDYKNREAAVSRLRILAKGAIDDKTRTPAQAASDYTTGLKNWTIADINRRSQIAKRVVDGEVDWTETVNWLNQPENTEGVPFDIIKALKSNAETEKANQDRRDDDNLKIVQEQQRGDIYAKIEANAEGTLNTINNSDLPEKEKASLRKLSGNPDVSLNYLEYDKVVDIIDGVARGTHTEEQADEAIKNGVGEHFDTTTATSLRTKLSQNLKADSPTKRPALTRGITAIEEVFDIQIKSQQFGPADFEEESAFILKKQRAKNDLEAYALSLDPADPTFDEKIEKKVELLTTPTKEETVRNWFGTLLEGFIIGTGGRGVGFGKKKAETFTYTAIDPETGKRMGSNDGVTWQKIP